jgi:hypothetical protein
MSKEALAKVVQRAISDAGFRRQLNSDPTGALRGFDLNADEVSALRAGDAGRLSTLGIDQRMSKAFVIGGAVAATRMAQSDLTAGAPTAFDDGASGVGRTMIPHDPEAATTADIDGAASSRSAINDDPDGFLAANARASGGTGSVRTGDDWKFSDRTASANAAPVEGSPEADAAAQQASGGGMANYPAHHGLAGPSAVGSARAGDDWARSGAARMDDSARVGSARLDDASGSSSGASVINDDPDGFLAANANADASGSVTRANVVNDDPDGFLAANANADLSGQTAGDGTAFLDESEAYLSKVGYDANAADTAVTDAHDRGGENIVTRIADDNDASGGTSATESGPNSDS